MINDAQLEKGMDVSKASSKEFEALQTILAAQGKPLSYEEAADIGYELLGFFEAFGEENGQAEDGHA